MTKKKSRKTMKAAMLPTKKFTAPTVKLGDYVYKHGTPKTTARNIEVMEALSNHVGIMTSTIASFGAVSMILLVETDMREPSVPEPWEHEKDVQGTVVSTSNGNPKRVTKNATLFGMEITLYRDTVKLIQKKQDEWLDIRANVFHLVL